MLLGQAALQSVHELGVQAPARPSGRALQLLPQVLRHAEEEAIDLPSHSGVIFTDLGPDIKW